jgi:class 3 adenylate cyclase/tetratricopeptide (TPR) repeat protein
MAERLQRLIPQEYVDRLVAMRGLASSERRLVTILFCDVTGSTAMAEDLDPEEVMDIMNEAFDVLIEPVCRREGTLARLMGDAVLAFFGAPLAHEDDPERACRAALDIVANARAYAARLEQERGITGFDVRVGINTGLVVVGEVGSDLRVEYTAMGNAVNVAARLEQHAPPGGVLISHDTFRHVRGVFDVQPQAPFMVKGKAEPLQTYLVERAKPRAFRMLTRGVEGVETRLIGREQELLLLRTAFEDAMVGAETRAVTVMGEAGVGKSRLLDEFTGWFELRPERVWYLSGRAVATTQAVPYGLWRNLFAFRFEILESDSAAMALDKFRAGMAGALDPERADLVGHLVGFGFSSSPAVAALLGSPNFGQLATVYLVRYFGHMVQQGPVVILLEDLHWADDSSLDLVRHLVAEIRDARLLIVGAARSALCERRPDWCEGEDAFGRLELKPLSRKDSRALVGEILQKAPVVPRVLRDLVVEGSEGNPFYVEELLKMLIEDGVVVPGEEEWHVELARLAEVRVPPTLTGVLQARLDTLPPYEKEVLQRASVVGREFWDRLVGELAGEVKGSEGVRSLLGALRGREMVYRRQQSAFAGTDEYLFKHSMLRDVTYETVLLKLRRKYHAQVAAWLEAHAGERLTEYLGVIAGHYELAGEWAKAAQYLRRSGEESHQVGGYRDAAAAFKRALALLPGEGAERADLLIWLGRALVRLSEYPVAAGHLEEGLSLARGVGEQRLEAAALFELGDIAWRQGDYDVAERRHQAGLEVARACGDLRAQALAHGGLGGVAYKRGDWEQAVGRAESSRTLYERVGDRAGMAAAVNLLGIVAKMQGDLERSAQYLVESLAIMREVGDHRGTANALNNLGIIALEQHRLEEARAYLKQALGMFEESGMRLGRGVALLNLGDLSIKQERNDAAWDYLWQVLQEARDLQTVPLILCAVASVARLYARVGKMVRAAELLGLVLRHPQCHSEACMTAEPVEAELRGVLSPEEMEAALARGAELDLDGVVEGILGAAVLGQGSSG